MNLLLHGIGSESGDSVTALNDLPVVTKDALAGKHGEYEIVLANPPFGKKSSVTIVNEAGEQAKESLVINRDDCPLKRNRRVPIGRSRLRASRVANWASTSKCEQHGQCSGGAAAFGRAVQGDGGGVTGGRVKSSKLKVQCSKFKGGQFKGRDGGMEGGRRGASVPTST